MEIHMIALTGGPCAGKSTALATLEQRLVNLKYRVILLDEMATNTINSGIHPANFGEVYQIIIAQLIDSREKIYLDFIKRYFKESDKVVVISDRGLMDGLAYSSPDFFRDVVLKSIRTNEIEAKHRYEGVFHLVTAAIGAEEFYTRSNNKARMETLEQAAEMDRKTLACWVGHPHLRVISNENVDFDGKTNNLMKEVLSLLGEPIPYETERKFLIFKPTITVLKQLGATKVDIVQTYLKSENGVERRIRQRGVDGNYTYYYTEKEKVSSGKRIERERSISQEEYISLLVEADTTKHQIVKERHCFVYKSKYFELDIYPFWDDKAILEIELSDINDPFKIPDSLHVIKEVTEDDDYKNSSLASLAGQNNL